MDPVQFGEDFAEAFGIEEGVSKPQDASSAGPTRKRKAQSRGGGTRAVDTTTAVPGKQELLFPEHNPANLPTDTSNLSHPKDLGFGVYPTSLGGPYRHMFQKLRDIADIIDARIDEQGGRIVKKHKLLVSTDKEGNEIENELAHVGMPNQEPVVVSGRVCLDASAGKLNASSIELEGSRETSNGERVHLNLEPGLCFTTFPGQIIAAEGTNTGGTVFTPTGIYHGAPLPMARTVPSDLVKHYYGPEQSSQPQVVEFIVAAGPFTSKNNMDYDPLQDLIKVIKDTKPDAVFMLGPFVDQTHPTVKNCELEDTFEKEFQNIVEQITDAVLKDTNTELVLVPSLKDVHHDSIYPQPPFQLPSDLEHERLRCVANPATVMIKEMTIGVTTTDILRDLASQETSKGQSGDRIGRLANHLLEQRSFYPLCPPAAGVNLEYEKTDNLRLPITPDIMLLPSDLKFFAKNVNNCVMVNPGRLVKHSTAGTFAKLAVHAPRRNDIPEHNKPISHNVHNRSVVEILRISSQTDGSPRTY